MSSPSYIGNTAWRTVSTEEDIDSEGLDTGTIVRRGDTSGSDSEWNSYDRGDTATSFGYSSMYLQRKHRSQSGNFDEVRLTYQGFASGAYSNPVDTSDSITQQATSLVSSSGENVQVKFMAQQTTTRWLYQGRSAPKQPQYPSVVPSDIAVGMLFDPHPATYSGTLQYVVRGRLMTFDRQELATGVWAVVESWVIRVEPS